jgi:hypothetical protein
MKHPVTVNTHTYGRGQRLTISDFPAVISGTSPDGLTSHAMLPDAAIRVRDQR